jgi:vitamin B12 transporter
MVMAVGWQGAGYAEEPSGKSPDNQPVVQTKEIVTSATKTEVPLSHVTSAIEVISGEELERNKTKTVIDALRLGQNIFAFSQGGPGTLANVRIRGAESKHTLVVLDGTIVNSPTDGAFNFANLTAENIERIEILRGAQSMLWGSDAIGGVINIVTKKGTGRPTANAYVEYGSFASIREGAQVSGAKGPVDVALSLSRWDMSSFSAVNYRRGAFERDGFHNWQASGKVGVALPKEGRLELALRWWNSDIANDSAFGNTRLDVLGSKSMSRSLIVSGMYEQPITSWWTQKLTVARNNDRQTFFSGTLQQNLVTGAVSVPFPVDSDLNVVNQRIEWQHNLQLAKPLLVTIGYQFRQEQGDAAGFYGADQPDRQITSNAGFAQAQFSWRDQLLLTAGVRQDSYNVFKDATTYRLTGGYLVPQTGTKFRTSYGTGFRTPTVNDLFFQGAGNPDLRPEKSQSFDAGVEQSLFGGKVQLSAGYFWNRFRDLIQFQSIPSLVCPPSTFGFCPLNVALAKTQGWEYGVKVQVFKGLELRGQYSMTLSRDLVTSRRLPRRPIDQATVGFTYQPIDPVRLNLDYRFVGSRNNDAANAPGQRQGSFGVVNVSASYDVAKQWQLFGRVDNLLDQRYEEVLFFGTPIRSVYGGLKFTY